MFDGTDHVDREHPLPVVGGELLEGPELLHADVGAQHVAGPEPVVRPRPRRRRPSARSATSTACGQGLGPGAGEPRTRPIRLLRG